MWEDGGSAPNKKLHEMKARVNIFSECPYMRRIYCRRPNLYRTVHLIYTPKDKESAKYYKNEDEGKWWL